MWWFDIVGPVKRIISLCTVRVELKYHDEVQNVLRTTNTMQKTKL